MVRKNINRIFMYMVMIIRVHGKDYQGSKKEKGYLISEMTALRDGEEMSAK